MPARSRNSVGTEKGSRIEPIPSSSTAASAEVRDALEGEESYQSPDDRETKKSKKTPPTTYFKQQRLSSWQPTIGAGVASTTLFIIAALCIPVGITLWHFADEINEMHIPYTDCKLMNDTNTTKYCWEMMGHFGPDKNRICHCNVSFSLSVDLKGTVFMYYELTNFYQNHRRYVRSRDDKQLFAGIDPPTSDCKPFARQEGTNKVYWPCGTNARAMFQDEIQLFMKNPNSSLPDKQVPLNHKGVAWPSDKENKFKNPPNWNTTKFEKDHAYPETWIKSPWELDPNDSSNNGLDNEDLIVWMRTAAFPDFRKLYRIIDNKTDKMFAKGLPKGNYFLNITYTFPVKYFNGTKAIILATASMIGGKNDFLGVCFVAIGVISLCFGFVFLFIRVIEKRSKVGNQTSSRTSTSQSAIPI